MTVVSVGKGNKGTIGEVRDRKKERDLGRWVHGKEVEEKNSGEKDRGEEKEMWLEE